MRVDLGSDFFCNDVKRGVGQLEVHMHRALAVNKPLIVFMHYRKQLEPEDFFTLFEAKFALTRKQLASSAP